MLFRSNLTTSDPRGFTDPNFFTAWTVSLIFTAGFIAVAFYNIYLVEKAKHKENGLDLLIEENPLVESLFIGLKSTKHAKRFWAYFILRRLLVASIAVFLKNQ